MVDYFGYPRAGDLTAPPAGWVNITFFPASDVDEVLEAFQYHVAIFYDGDLSRDEDREELWTVIQALWGETNPADHAHGWPDGLNATPLSVARLPQLIDHVAIINSSAAAAVAAPGAARGLMLAPGPGNRALPNINRLMALAERLFFFHEQDHLIDMAFDVLLNRMLLPLTRNAVTNAENGNLPVAAPGLGAANPLIDGYYTGSRVMSRIFKVIMSSHTLLTCAKQYVNGKLGISGPVIDFLNSLSH